MKPPKDKTRLIIFIGIIALGIWDLACVFFDIGAPTVSQVMVEIGMTSPFVVFVLGLTFGHFFFRAGEQT